MATPNGRTTLDLERLKIDRGSKPKRWRRSGGGGSGWFGKLLFLALVLGAGWLFRDPLFALVDRLRLPSVAVVRVSKTSALAASAVSGTAANGYVVARHRAALSADTPGRIVEMNVEEGSVVKRGDVVARLFADEYEAALRSADANLRAAHAAGRRATAERDAALTRIVEQDARIEAAAARLTETQAGQRLAELDHRRAETLLQTNVVARERLDDAAAELEAATARVSATDAALAEARAVRTTLEASAEVAAASIEESEATAAVIEALRDQAQATLDKTNVRAPFDGIVVLKDAEVGEVVSPNSMGGNSRGSVATMVDFESLEVQVELPETNLEAVAVGAATSIYLDAFPDQPYEGRVLRIWPTANRQKATIEVRVGFDRTDERLRPEMGARVVFVSGDEPRASAPTDEADRVLVPTECIVRVDGRQGVFVLERDVALFRAVEIGGERSGRVLVDRGLEGGELVVTTPPLSLADGDRVRLADR